MPLLNYTTTVPALRTINEIGAQLAKAGAAQVLTEYGPNAMPCGIAFAITGPAGTNRYRLPIDAGAVHRVLERDRSVAPRYRTREHAERVAWRIMKDWIEAQLAIIATRMVTLDQVFLPYMLTETGVTVYDLFAAQRLSLPAAQS